MPEYSEELDFESKLKNSFTKVKDHMNKIEQQLNNQNSTMNNQKDDISTIKLQIKTIIKELRELKDKISLFTISNGNKGVFRQTDNRQTTDTRQINTNISTLKSEFEQKILSLTEKEFAVFMAIYHLEEELHSPVTYPDIAKHLKLSQSSVRDHTSELLLKGLPLIKNKINNRKVSLSIDRSFKDLNLASKLLSFRQFDTKQTTLFDV